MSTDLSAEDVEVRNTHPLMPDLRSGKLNNVNWPQTYHDRLGTGFSPLTCRMKAQPSPWSVIRVPATVNWVHTFEDSASQQQLLVYDGSLQLVSPEGDGTLDKCVG